MNLPVYFCRFRKLQFPCYNFDFLHPLHAKKPAENHGFCTAIPRRHIYLHTPKIHT